MTEIPQSAPENAPLGTPLPAAKAADDIRRLLESPDAVRVREFLAKCAVPNLSDAELEVLENEAVGLEMNIDEGPEADELCDAVRLTKMFILSRRGSRRLTEAQGEWRAALARLEAFDDWRGSLAAWNTGKIESQMAGILPPEAQLLQLRKSFEAFARAAKRGEKPLPMTMPVSGAGIDLSYLQSPEQRGTTTVDRIAPPHRLVGALGVTLSYAEKQAGNEQESAAALAVAREQHALGKTTYKDSPFLRLNLAISSHIADGTIDGTGKPEELEAYLAELDAEPTIDAFKKLEWSAHAHGLLALATGDDKHVDECMERLEAIAIQRPPFMAIIAIEPTFKEFAKRFAHAKARLDQLLAVGK